MQDWINFLATQASQPLQHNNAICNLSDTGLLYVGGDDASDFLQNQLSNDIKQIDQNSSQLSSLSNAKGRMFGIFRILQIEGGYILIMPKSILPEIQQRLQKFIIMSKVMLADISDSFASISITTDNAELLKKHHITEYTVPEHTHRVSQTDNQINLQLHSSDHRLRFLILNNDAQQMITLWKQLTRELTINDASHWRLQEIEAGIPTIYPETSEAFVLQMTNLHLLNGVSFKKGCFPGQEVVARMKYLGKLKRHMFLAKVSGSHCPKPGDGLTTRGSELSDGSGKVVDAIALSETDNLMLFISKIEATENNELELFGHPEQLITLKKLPYTYED